VRLFPASVSVVLCDGKIEISHQNDNLEYYLPKFRTPNPCVKGDCIFQDTTIYLNSFKSLFMYKIVFQNILHGVTCSRIDSPSRNANFGSVFLVLSSVFLLFCCLNISPSLDSPSSIDPSSSMSYQGKAPPSGYAKRGPPGQQGSGSRTGSAPPKYSSHQGGSQSLSSSRPPMSSGKPSDGPFWAPSFSCTSQNQLFLPILCSQRLSRTLNSR
jgi:hypothetical protein